MVEDGGGVGSFVNVVEDGGGVGSFVNVMEDGGEVGAFLRVVGECAGVDEGERGGNEPPT